MSGFQDHFSAGARGYAAFRPTYPAAVFEWIASQCAGHDLAWDCATGNGQAARGL
ncbi:MAG: SAM-dependent methyltransferase, partial [Gemmatimonadota bacterium]